MSQILILGIETSCDETAAAVVASDKQVLSHQIFSQMEVHQAFGGVVPEIGARAHLEKIQEVIKATMVQANLSFPELDGIAATCGPGLIGGVLVGAVTAKAIAATLQKPFMAVNHLEAHALSVRLTEDVSFPYLLLLVSGGHCQLIYVKNLGSYQILGTTLDDAAGETFDKVARLLGLPYPGGPAIEILAQRGNPYRFNFPRPLLHKEGYNFSFSGLKTAVLRAVEGLDNPTEQDRKDIAASFQQAVSDIFTTRINQVLTQETSILHTISDVVIAGGVAANHFLRNHLKETVQAYGKRFVAPPLTYCTDNGAMVAWAGVEHFLQGHVDSLTFSPRPRWPLGPLTE